MERLKPLRVRITAWLAVGGYALVASGLPLPLGGMGFSAIHDTDVARRLAAKDRSRPFPCMDKPCGCDSAESCFTRCCCHSPAESLTWARAHGVDSKTLASLERRVRPAATGISRPDSCCRERVSSCCQREAAVAEDHGPIPGEPPSLTVSFAAVAAAAEGGVSEADDSARRQSVTLRAMLACSGIVAEWLAAGAALPPPRIEVSSAAEVVRLRVFADVSATGVRAAPEAPPPRWI